MSWEIGTRVTTPPVRGRGAVETTTASAPFLWSGIALVALSGLPGLWECRLLRPAPESA